MWHFWICILRGGTGFGCAPGDQQCELGKVTAIVFTNHDLANTAGAAAALGARHFLDKLRDFDLLPELPAADQSHSKGSHRSTRNRFASAAGVPVVCARNRDAALEELKE